MPDHSQPLSDPRVFAGLGLDRLGMTPLRGVDPVRVGPFLLAALLGSGGMGRIYLGRDAADPHRGLAAVKVIRPEYAEDPQFRRRFAREAESLARVQGGQTAVLLGSGFDDDLLWMATEYIPGLSLSAVIADHGVLDLAAAWRLAADLGRAVEAMAEADVVHRDIKPSNVILGPDGCRVIDFGISQAGDTSSITMTGQQVGTPAYMSPEQVRGLAVGPASDVFAIGSVLAYAVAGNAPFGDGTSVDVLHRVAFDPPKDEILARVGALDPGLAGLVASCLDKDQTRRPTPGAVIAAALTRQVPAPWPQALNEAVMLRLQVADSVRQVPLPQPPEPGAAVPRGAGAPLGAGGPLGAASAERTPAHQTGADAPFAALLGSATSAEQTPVHPAGADAPLPAPPGLAASAEQTPAHPAGAAAPFPAPPGFDAPHPPPTGTPHPPQGRGELRDKPGAVPHPQSPPHPHPPGTPTHADTWPPQGATPPTVAALSAPLAPSAPSAPYVLHAATAGSGPEPSAPTGGPGYPSLPLRQEPEQRASRRRAALLVGAAVVAVAAIAVTALLVTSPSGSHAVTATGTKGTTGTAGSTGSTGTLGLPGPSGGPGGSASAQGSTAPAAGGRASAKPGSITAAAAPTHGAGTAAGAGAPASPPSGTAPAQPKTTAPAPPPPPRSTTPAAPPVPPWIKNCTYYSGSAETDPGAKGNAVKEIQCILVNRGYSVGPSGVDGDFGADTKAAVIAFQKAKGLSADGGVGPQTWPALRSKS
ncbi:protein kinase domain-containing protein [Streptacidiphilus cavernicola]|uniref:Protein kinase n=1 Tax=Streptacidiphilus cavernicola TaxID=3342716 RepID=A0ABV6VSB3_9ACTN